MDLQARLRELAERFRIPGAAAAVLHRGELTEAATGVLNLATRVEATPDSLFQIGSITKVFTARLVLQLVEAGRIALDDPVRKHLPWFKVASPEATATVTVAHLLTHTSGIDGDWFPDLGTDPDGIERYVRGCADLGQLHAPGDGISYTNAGPIILAAMLRELTGKAWDALLRERILEPLRAQRMTTDYAELPRHGVAVGHLPDLQTKQLAVAKHLHLPQCMGPTGATLHSNAGDLARFGAGFLRTSPPTIRASWPTAPWLGVHMGLGWMLHEWSGRTLFGHDGATIGQSGFLRIAPHADLVVALLCNGGPAKNLYYALFREIFRELAQTELPQRAELIDPSRFDRARVLGTYQNKSGTAEIFVDGDELKLRATPRELTHVFGPETWPLRPIAPDACRIANPALDMPELIVFHHFDAPDGRARFASLNYRDLRRT